MLWKVFYIIGILSTFGYEIEEYEPEITEYSSEEVVDDSPLVFDMTEGDHEKFTLSQDLADDDEDSDEDTTAPEIGPSFAGPVKAKGSVTMAANFGFDPTMSYPPFSSFGAPWFPSTFIAQNFFLPPRQFIPPMPFTSSPIPLLSTFLPGIGTISDPENSIENLLNGETESNSNEIFLIVKPLIKEDLYESDDTMEPEADVLSSEENENPELLLDEDFPDYDDLDAEDTALNDVTTKEEVQEEPPAGGAVFGGFLPAKGAVKIAARF